MKLYERTKLIKGKKKKVLFYSFILLTLFFFISILFLATLPCNMPTFNSFNCLPYETLLPEDIEAYITKYEQQAQIAFDPTEKMKVGETKIISAYITSNLSKNVSKEYGLGEPLEQEYINITPRTQVILIGEETDAFDIETIPPNFDGVRPIIGERTTIWSWQVTPLKSGKHKLLLSVDYVIPLNPSEPNNYQYYKTLKNIEKEIEVEANPIYFIESNWQWVIGVIIIPVLPSTNSWLKRKLRAVRTRNKKP